ncbi:MAG TPA: type II toxin-antitoxin system HicA family toxin [Gelria sp.]|jgi:hypothetical protein|nr:type II toxin-antitoxin system HicA family toxin [Gelria sp.]
MPSWKELKRFCEKDGWDLYKQTDHWYYQKQMPDGTVKRTKVSMSNKEIGYNLWREIRNKQLQVTQDYFNKHI